MGFATLATMTLPICMNSAAEKSLMERVSVNQVPQKTPVVNVKNSSAVNWRIRVLTSDLFVMECRLYALDFFIEGTGPPYEGINLHRGGDPLLTTPVQLDGSLYYSFAACMLMDDSATSVSFSSAAFSSVRFCSSNCTAFVRPRVCAKVRRVP